MDTKYENKKYLYELNELKFCEVSWNLFSNRCWNFQLSILKNKKVLFLKNYNLGHSFYIGQESFNRWRFAVPIFREGFTVNKQKSVNSVVEFWGQRSTGSRFLLNNGFIKKIFLLDLHWLTNYIELLFWAKLYFQLTIVLKTP